MPPGIDDDELLFSDDETAAPGEPAPAGLAGEALPGWRLLIVDDDEFIHQTTTYALMRFGFAGRGLELTHAYSAREAREKLAKEGPFACLLLDVVMESDTAGLDLVHHIRRDMADDLTRIILRTGQAGRVPEIRVVQEYDINDYREKSQTTVDHLHTSLTSALRSYQQITTIQDNRRGLERVIRASAALFARQELHDFAAGVLAQLASLLRAPADGLVCNAVGRGINLLAVAGRHAGRRLGALTIDDPLRPLLEEAFARRSSVFGEGMSCLHLPRGKLGEVVVLVHTETPVGEIDRRLLELLGINIAIGFDNAMMYGQVEQLAFSDRLTGLPNLNGYLRALAALPRSGQRQLAFVDIDHFEVVNDGLGRKVGDALLRLVAVELRSLPGVDLVARVGGDVFGLAADVAESEVAPWLLRICAQLNRTLEVEGHSVSLSVSVGAARLRGGETTPEVACANVGMALKAAKRERQGSFLQFRDSMGSELQERLRLSARMDRGLKRGEFLLHYQPQVSLQSGRMVGVEALVRWRDGEQLVPPDRFIPVAESSGLILPLGRWVLAEAVAQQRRWAAQGLHLRMAINLSARQLLEDEGLVDYLRELLGEDASDAGLFELEVTESGVIGDHEAGRGRLELLRGLGVQIAIDDFGTGYSSLGQLRHLPAHRLKIDRVFIHGIARDPDDLHIAEMIVGMGRRIGLSVLAEGVEDEDQRAILARLGCHEAQGWFYARALPAEDVPGFAAKVGVES